MGPRPKYGYRWVISTYELDGQLHRVREGYEEDPVTGPVVPPPVPPVPSTG